MTDYISRADAIEVVASITMSIHLSDVICDKLLALPSADAVSRESYINAVGYVEWLEKLIVDSETFEWLCEDINDREWCEKNCNYSSIQAECLRHLYKAKQSAEAEPKWNCTANFISEQLERLKDMTDEERLKLLQTMFSSTDAVGVAHDIPEYCSWSQTYTNMVQSATSKASADAEQVTSKLKKPCDSLLKDDSDECKEQKSKLEHDREWIIGCIKHDGFIKTDRFDKANQIILDALSAEAVPQSDQYKRGRGMTREEAKEILQGSRITSFRPNGTARVKEALDMAIEALQTDAVSRINYTPKPCEYANCDCVDVVRCKDCKWRKGIYCEHEDGMVTICDDDFCSCGERSEPEHG